MPTINAASKNDPLLPVRNASQNPSHSEMPHTLVDHMWYAAIRPYRMRSNAQRASSSPTMAAMQIAYASLICVRSARATVAQA